MLKTLEAHWRPRWSTTAQVSESDWQKITQFAKVFMTQHNFTWQPITRTQWPNTVKQFKARAAICPGGFDRCDLQFMPDSFVDSFIHLVNSIETEDVAWPQQLMFGAVVGLAKNDQAHDESHYRTIMLFPHYTGHGRSCAPSSCYVNWPCLYRQRLWDFCHAARLGKSGFTFTPTSKLCSCTSRTTAASLRT